MTADIEATVSQKKFKIATLGCRTNQYESQAFQNQLEALGYTAAASDEKADICIVNTCTVTQSADTHSRREIRQLVKGNPEAKVIVTGCYADRKPNEITNITGVSAVVPNAEKEQIISKLFPEVDSLPEFTIMRFEAHTRAFVKVQDGCNSFCTYCIIPYVRGRSRSRSLSDILNEVRQLIANGYKEVVITGINVGDYDGNPQEGQPPVRLAELVRAIDALPGLERLRISSIDPDEVDDDLADAVLNGKHTCPSMHIVLQSGSNVILKRMNRKYTRQQFFDSVDRLRKANPRFTFTTDIITGFPGETDADHRDTLEVMRYVQFAKVHMFPYSPRERTRAALYPNRVSDEVIKIRKHEILSLSEQESFHLREKFVGQTMLILTESFDETRPHEICGHTDNFLLVWIPAEELQPNVLVEVLLEKNTPEGFIGKPLKKLEVAYTFNIHDSSTCSSRSKCHCA